MTDFLASLLFSDQEATGDTTKRVFNAGRLVGALLLGGVGGVIAYNIAKDGVPTGTSALEA